MCLHHFQLLKSIGEDHLSPAKLQQAEKFLCLIDNQSQASSIDDTRCRLFPTTTKLELLPLIHDALHYHILGAHYQANCLEASNPEAHESSWSMYTWLEDGKRVAVLMSLQQIQ